MCTIILPGCQKSSVPQQPDINQIKTEIFYLDRSMLPPDSELIVVLEDISNKEVSATIISSQTITVNTAPPYQVVLDYDTALIKQTASYAIRAEIKKTSELLYSSPRDQYLFTGKKLLEGDYNFEIKVVKPVIPPTPDVTLDNTYWKAITLNDDRVETPEGSREAFLQLRKGNQIRGFLGCNAFNGEYILDGNTLNFTKIAATMKLCGNEANRLEANMSTVLAETVKYKINGESLTLYDQSNNAIALFKAVYF
jgi:putative lipoprotein